LKNHPFVITSFPRNFAPLKILISASQCHHRCNSTSCTLAYANPIVSYYVCDYRKRRLCGEKMYFETM